MRDEDEVLPAFPETATCRYCRGAIKHDERQRCPAAPPIMAGAPLGTVLPAPAAAGSFAPIPRPQDVRHARPGAKQASPFGFWRFLGATTGTVIVMICVSVYGWLIFDDLTSAEQSGGEVLLWIGVTALIGLVFGAGLLWRAWRPFAKAVYVFLALTLILLGYFMLIFAPVYRQINDRGIAEYRASNALYFFGILTLGAGIMLGGLCLRWALERDALARLSRWRRPLGAVYGVLLGLVGLMIMGLLAIVIAVTPDDEASDFDPEFSVVAGVIAFTALAMQFLVPGMILTYHGIRSSIGWKTGSFLPPWGLAIAVAFAAVIAVGQLNMRLNAPYAWPMPALHTLAAVLPGAGYVAFAMRGSWLGGRAIRGVTWRQITLAWGLAIAVGAMSAGIVNTIGGLGVTVLLLVHSGAFESVNSIDGAFTYNVWDVIADANLLLTNNEQWMANIIAIAIIPPLGEEFLKGLSVRFLLRQTMTRGQAFALGAAAGAGFGFVEALLYGAGVVTDDLSAWWQIMMIRGGTSLHCLATGLVGLGWWYWTIGARKERAIALYFSAVTLHAIRNGFSVTLDSEIFWIGTLEDTTIEYIAYGFVIVLATAFIAAIPLVARALREPPPAPVADTPLGSMRPWLTY